MARGSVYQRSDGGENGGSNQWSSGIGSRTVIAFIDSIMGDARRGGHS